jgi:AcrR family transcriptional regulator
MRRRKNRGVTLARKAGRPLTRERILDGALKLVDERGLSGFSIRSLGDKLGVKGMAVYYYFPSKTDIMDALVAQLMSQVDLAAEEGDWRERMRRLHLSLRSVILQHPSLLPAVILRPFNTAPAVRITETVLDILLNAGFDEMRALHAYQALRAYVLGYTMTETVGFLSDPPSWDNRERMRIQDYGDQGFTRMLQVIPAAAVFDHDEDYASGLDAMLSGLQDVLSESRRRRLRSPIPDHSEALASPLGEKAAD